MMNKLSKAPERVQGTPRSRIQSQGYGCIRIGTQREPLYILELLFFFVRRYVA